MFISLSAQLRRSPTKPRLPERLKVGGSGSLRPLNWTRCERGSRGSRLWCSNISPGVWA